MRAALNACQGISRGPISCHGDSFHIDPGLAPAPPLHNLLLRICEFGHLFRYAPLGLMLHASAICLCKTKMCVLECYKLALQHYALMCSPAGSIQQQIRLVCLGSHGTG